MKILRLLSFVSLLLIYSCSGDKGTVCGGVTGTLKISNNSSYKYDIYIDDVKKTTMAAGGSGTWPLTENYYAVKAVQAEGVIGTPTEYNWNALVTACGSTQETIP